VLDLLVDLLVDGAARFAEAEGQLQRRTLELTLKLGPLSVQLFDLGLNLTVGRSERSEAPRVFLRLGRLLGQVVDLLLDLSDARRRSPVQMDSGVEGRPLPLVVKECPEIEGRDVDGLFDLLALLVAELACTQFLRHLPGLSVSRVFPCHSRGRVRTTRVVRTRPDYTKARLITRRSRRPPRCRPKSGPAGRTRPASGSVRRPRSRCAGHRSGSRRWTRRPRPRTARPGACRHARPGTPAEAGSGTGRRRCCRHSRRSPRRHPGRT